MNGVEALRSKIVAKCEAIIKAVKNSLHVKVAKKSRGARKGAKRHSKSLEARILESLGNGQKTIAELRAQFPNSSSPVLRNALARLKKNGKIVANARGVYALPENSENTATISE
jgi:DNA-binding HxlR family transcriptional regulator